MIFHRLQDISHWKLEAMNNAYQTTLVQTAVELAHLLKGNRKLFEKAIFEEGSGVVGIFCDPNFKDSFQNMRELKTDIIHNAIEDVAIGGGRLLTATLGVVYQMGKLQPYLEMFGSNPSGNVIYSINLKQRAAFKQWRDGADEMDLSQEEVNAAIYRLAVELSEVL